MIAIDATLFLLVLYPNARPPKHPETNEPISMATERVENLFRVLDLSKTTVLIPSPIFAELLVWADDAGTKQIEIFQKSRYLRIAPFDAKAAIECALLLHENLEAGDFKGGLTGTRAKAKFDHQIIAIAKAENVKIIYSDDPDIRKLAARVGIHSIATHELDVPVEDRQERLDLPDGEDDKVE